ncbi:MAG: K(+)-transporting ATPase subunit F [Candidatus Dadabacteria bacterium]|nr:MAG: K(+)-transporting ATPase subunit F [Candidatus Dadabacteria bacterium]
MLWIASLVLILCFVYLVYAIIKPERF